MHTVAQKSTNIQPPLNARGETPGQAHPKQADRGVDPILQLQRTMGNQAVQRFLAPKTGVIQMKPRISKPSDEDEKEADQIADQVSVPSHPKVVPPVGTPAATPVTLAQVREPLEAVARRIARLAVGPSSAMVNLQGGPGPVVSVVRNLRTGRLSVGLNTGPPAKMTDYIQKALNAHKERLAAGKVKVVHTEGYAMEGGHAEVNALNQAIAEEEAILGRTMTAREVQATFEMHNLWLKGDRQFTAAVRCEHCSPITKHVRVTESLLEAENVVPEKVNVPQGGKVTTAGEKILEAESSNSKIAAQKPPKTTSTATEAVAEAAPGIKVQGPSSVGSKFRLVSGLAANLLLMAVTYYLTKWHAEKQARKFNSDLQGRLPEINVRLENKEAEIVEKQNAFPLVYGNVTILYFHEKYAPEDYEEGSMIVQDVAVSHQNYQTPEKLITPGSPLSEAGPSFSLTFSLPLFEQKLAEKGVSDLSDYQPLKKMLADTNYKGRLSGAISLYKLTKENSSLETLVVSDLLSLLKDENALVRLAAAHYLGAFKAKVAVQYIRDVLPITKDSKHRELIHRALRELE